jgi:hypothetical protein
MIGSDVLGSILGAAPAGDPERLTNITRAMIRAGLSPVLLKPGTKDPMCILSTTAAKKADMEAQAAYVLEHPDRPADKVRHDCGFKHVLDDPAKVTTIVKRLQGIHGPDLNLGLHLGRSRRLVVDVDTPGERGEFLDWWVENVSRSAPPITVESPGFRDADGNWIHHGGGHWYFTVPDDFPFPAGKVFKGPGGWAAMWGESQVLVPPSVRKEGPYRLVGGEYQAPVQLLNLIHAAPQNLTDHQAFEITGELGQNPIEQWSAHTSWESLLIPQGWTRTSTNDCGCPNFRGPGNHASDKSATGHETGCTVFDTSTGWGPLKIWTDHPPQGLPAEGAVTKFDFVARMYGGGDVSRTKQVLGIPEHVPLPSGGVVLDPKAMAGTGVRKLKVTRASEITARATRWSWLDMTMKLKWIPQGALTLLGGREGVGKSTLAYWLIAMITRGALPGDNYGRPRSVIIAATEDAWEQTIVPRLMAAGADLSLVLRVDVIRADDLMEGLTLPTDVGEVEQLCREENVGLILLDPLLGTIKGSLDTHKDSEVRQALEPLSRLAHDAQVTVIGLIHQNKSSSGDLLTKLMGSRAFSAVARAVLVCAEEKAPVPTDMDVPERTFLFGQLKSNLGSKVMTTYRYRINERVVGTDPEFGDPIVSSAIEWIGHLDENVEQVLDEQQAAASRSDKPRGEAGGWILEFVREGGTRSRSEVLEAGQVAGHSRNTLLRAVDLLLDALPPALVKQQHDRVVLYSVPQTHQTQVQDPGLS